MLWLDRIWSWVLVILILATIPATVLLVRLARFVCKRVKLAVALRRMGAMPLRPLAWLIPWRSACDYRLPLRDPATGRVTHTLAIQLIPTVLGGTEYCLGDMERWQRQRSILMPMARSPMPMSLGYRRLRPRRADRIFRKAPPDAVRVYLFHPHPFALTLALRNHDVHNSYRGVDTVSVPLWREGILLLDLASLRVLAESEGRAREQVLTP